MRRSDDRYVGIQVKTKESGLMPFKTTDDAIKNSLKKFLLLEKKYGNKFFQYVIISNCGFWHEKKDHFNLIHILNKLRESTDKSILNDDDFINIKDLSEGTPSITDDIIYSALKKLNISTGPGLDNVREHLISCLSHYQNLSEKTHPELMNISSKLLQKIYEASSLNYTSPSHDYFVLSENPQAQLDTEILDGKKITKDILESIIQEFLLQQIPLITNSKIDLACLPPGTRRLKKKMIAGDISISNIGLFEDYKYSAEYLFQKILYKQTPEKANEIFNSLSLIIRTECQESYDICYSEKESFGNKMLQDVRKRIRTRFDQDCKKIFCGTYEHLMGIVSIITEECGIWWSRMFEIKDE